MVTTRQPLLGKLVWRISATDPLGAWVDLAKLREAASTELPEVSSGNRIDSSFDLLQGTDVTEIDYGDTVPTALLDELFATVKKD